ncbi:hypothetical protein Golomagni_04127, partial [Golovinomyces magnicellulatus]
LSLVYITHLVKGQTCNPLFLDQPQTLSHFYYFGITLLRYTTFQDNFLLILRDMSSKSYSSTDDGVKTPGTLTESEEKIQLNGKKIAGSAPQTISLVEPVLDYPSIFVWCLRCSALIRIDYPVGHRMSEITLCSPGDSRFFGTVCLNCIEFEKIIPGKNQFPPPRSQIMEYPQEQIYLSFDCVGQSNAFDTASYLTQNSCDHISVTEYGRSLMQHIPIKRIHNLCNAKCRLRTVVTDENRTEDYENFLVAGFM